MSLKNVQSRENTFMVHQKLSWEALRRTIIRCRRCPRLVEFRENVPAKPAFKSDKNFGENLCLALAIIMPGFSLRGLHRQVMEEIGPGVFLQVMVQGVF